MQKEYLILRQAKTYLFDTLIRFTKIHCLKVILKELKYTPSNTSLLEVNREEEEEEEDGLILRIQGT